MGLGYQLRVTPKEINNPGRDQQTMALGLYLACLFLSIKFYWQSPMPIHFCIDSCCFHTTMAVLTSCDRDYVAYRLKYLLSVPL